MHRTKKDDTAGPFQALIAGGDGVALGTVYRSRKPPGFESPPVPLQRHLGFEHI